MVRVGGFGAILVVIEVAIGWSDIYRRDSLPVWYTGMLTLHALVIFSAVVTYFFMVVIALIGRRTFITRWFLYEPAAPPTSNPVEQPT